MSYSCFVRFAAAAGSIILLPAFASAEEVAQRAWENSAIGRLASPVPRTETLVISEMAEARPLMKIAGMQAWAVINDQGEREMALTTEDGLTIIGRIIGPQGEDLSAALLGTDPAAEANRSPIIMFDQGAAPQAEDEAVAPISSSTPMQPMPEAARPRWGANAPDATSLVADGVTLAETIQLPASTAPPPWATRSPSQERDGLAALQATLPDPAKSTEELLDQATRFAVWFPVAEAKPNAPTVYFFADPHCPYCAEATRQLAPAIEAGQVDLRVILMTITGPEAMRAAISIIQSDDAGPGTAFLDYELARVSSSRSSLTLLEPNQYDPDVAKALVRNVLWSRNNQVPGTPFWLYASADGAQAHMGAWDPSVIDRALPLPAPQKAAALQATQTETN